MDRHQHPRRRNRSRRHLDWRVEVVSALPSAPPSRGRRRATVHARNAGSCHLGSHGPHSNSTDSKRAALESSDQLTRQALSPARSAPCPDASIVSIARFSISHTDTDKPYSCTGVQAPLNGSPLEEMVDLEWLDGNSRRPSALRSRARGTDADELRGPRRKPCWGARLRFGPRLDRRRYRSNG